MGLLRKSLFFATAGIVAPNSKKQRMAKKTLTALEGGTPGDIRRAGGRYDFAGFIGQSSVTSSHEDADPPAAMLTESEQARDDANRAAAEQWQAEHDAARKKES